MSGNIKRGYMVRHISEVQAVPCPCGSSTRIITREDTPVANLHVTHIMDSEKHYQRGAPSTIISLKGTDIWS